MNRSLRTFLVTVAGVGVLLGLKIRPDDTTYTYVPTSTGDATDASPGETRTVTGDPVDTPFGTVQVQVTMAGDTLTGIPVLQAPDHSGNDAEISAYAIPLLEEQALAAQSADIDTVSGATYTSTGYIASLQSALDKARG